jgi:4-amino-4-deoxy-L-arabinose transferase-like glycosyltransferase
VNERGASQARRDGSWLAVILVIAALLRLPFVATPFDDDEFYTLENALLAFQDPTPPAVARYPTTFLLTRLAIEICGPTGLALRVLPLLTGLAAVLLITRLGRRIVGPRAALFAAAVVAVWPFHQYWSGTGRYYAPLFLCGIGMIEAQWRVLFGARHELRIALVSLLSWLVVAASIHPSGMLGLGPIALAVFSPAVRARLGRRGVVAVAMLTVAAAVAIASLGVLENVERVLSGEGGLGADAKQLAQNLAFNASLPILVLAAGGLLVMVRERGEPRESGGLLGVAAGAPVVALFALAIAGHGVQGRYATIVMPALALLAGVALARFAAALPRSLAMPSVAAALLAACGPSLASNVSDGNRHDFRTATRVVAPYLAGDALLFAEGHGLFRTFLYGVERRLPAGTGDPPFPRHFGESPPSAQQLAALESNRGRAVFVLREHEYRGLRGAYPEWLRRHARRIGRVGQPRLDYHRNSVLLLEADLGDRS